MDRHRILDIAKIGVTNQMPHNFAFDFPFIGLGLLLMSLALSFLRFQFSEKVCF